MHLAKKTIAFSSTVLLLAGCLGPQTYFSEVFNTLYDTYYPTQNSFDRLNMNYEVNATITADGKVNTFAVYFFEVGFKLVNIVPETKDGVETTRTLTLLYDYQENGIFGMRSYANNPSNVEKVFSNFDDDDFEIVNQAIDVVESNFSDEIKGIINNQATNLIIGGQPVDQDVKIYNLPVGNFVDLATFESTAGFVPTGLTVKVTFTTSTLAGLFEVNATADGKNYLASVELSNPEGLVASDYLLTATEKATYEGYPSAA